VQPNLRVNVTNQGYRHCCFAPFFRRERSRGGRELCQFLLPARQPQLREGPILLTSNHSVGEWVVTTILCITALMAPPGDSYH
jgi:hypothetical protein